MTQDVQEQASAAPQLKCPKCGGPAQCYRRDVGGVNYEDEYTLECETCGNVGRRTEYGGSFSADDSTATTCPFCHQTYLFHSLPPGTTEGGLWGVVPSRS